jgi:two-component system, chemotaxis family, chemotaxis protein CheY
MTQASQTVIALVDDDSIFQLTASRMLKATELIGNILQFSNGEDALRFLHDNVDKRDKLPDILFLDINMPLVDGWAFLEDYALLKQKMSKKILIYMVSSSIDPMDMNRAKSNNLVEDYLIKPITRLGFEELLHKFNTRSAN